MEEGFLFAGVSASKIQIDYIERDISLNEKMDFL